MLANQILLNVPIYLKVSVVENLEKEATTKKIINNNPKTAGVDTIIQPPINKRHYAKPIIPRSAQRDKIEIW